MTYDIFCTCIILLEFLSEISQLLVLIQRAMLTSIVTGERGRTLFPAVADCDRNFRINPVRNVKVWLGMRSQDK